MSAVRTAILTFAFGAGGVALSWLWYRGSGWVLGLALLLGITVIMVGRVAGHALLPLHPVAAVNLYGLQAVGFVAFTVAGAALVIIVGIEIAAPGGSPGDSAAIATEKNELKAVISAASTAVSALVTALFVRTDSYDSEIASIVQEAFEAAYPEGTSADPRVVGATIELPHGSAAIEAVYGNRRITDWSAANRHKRASAIAAYFLEHSPVPA